MKHYNVTFEPDEKRIKIHHGETLLEAAARAGIILNSPCGGRGTCEKCKVRIEPDNQTVLACQYTINRDLTVTIPDSSRYYSQTILAQGIEIRKSSDPNLKKVFLETASADPEKLRRSLSRRVDNSSVQLCENLLSDLPRYSATSIEQEGLTVVIKQPDNPNSSVLAVAAELADTTEHLYGVAVDLGTTTVVTRLLNLRDNSVLATEADLNPQARFGADVVARISYADSDEKRRRLQKVVLDALDKLIARLCDSADIPRKHIYEICLVGNTTMNHLLLDLPVESIGQAPYKAYSLCAYDVLAEQLGLNCNPAANLHTVENIAAFVGSDIVAAGLAADIANAAANTLLIDIGTNGELLLATQDKLYAASCAAGPALEGAGITFGSGAVKGAIQAVQANRSDIDIDVISDVKPASICGSGLIDALAVMLDLGVLDQTGRILNPDQVPESLSARIRSRLVTYDNAPAFCLSDHSHPEVIITQRDIRQVQLAKAAIRAGITVLIRKTGLSDKHLDSLLIAGAFGNYIKTASAVRIGLLPDLPPEKFHFIGNAAGTGAEMILISRDARKKAASLASSVEYIETAGRKDFFDLFADCLPLTRIP